MGVCLTLDCDEYRMSMVPDGCTICNYVMYCGGLRVAYLRER